MADDEADVDGLRRRNGKLRRRRKVNLVQRGRNNFLTGLVVVLPIVLTIWLTWWFVTFVDSQVLPLVPAAYNPRTYVGGDIPGYGVVVFIVFTTVVGYFAKKVFGKQLIIFGESLVDRTPVVRSIYQALKQIVETVLSQSKSSFRQACLVEYPRRGIWAVGFISTETTGEVPEKVGQGAMTSVFLPTTPNPTSGFLLFVPKEDVVPLDMTIEEAAKLIISAGLVTPPTTAEREAHRLEVEARRAAFARKVNPDGTDAE